MSGLLLTEAERNRFADWLEREAEQSDMMAEQALSMKGGRDDLPGGNPQDAMWDQAAKRERMWAGACMFVAKKLRAMESFTVSSNDANQT